MTDLSPYELRVLRQMAKGGDEDLICGAALWVALGTLKARGLTEVRFSYGGPDAQWVHHDITDAGRAIVRARDTELTEAKND